MTELQKRILGVKREVNSTTIFSIEEIQQGQRKKQEIH